MPSCKTCQHPDVKEIDRSINASDSYRRIATQFRLSDASVARHARNHVKPIIKAANKVAQERTIERITKHREEVTYAPLLKVKMIQEKILNDIDTESDGSKRNNLYRSFCLTIQEEAKLCGLYQKDGRNLSDIERVVKAFTQWEEDHPGITPEERIVWIGRFAEQSGMDEDELRRYIQIQDVNDLEH